MMLGLWKSDEIFVTKAITVARYKNNLKSALQTNLIIENEKIVSLAADNLVPATF